MTTQAILPRYPLTTSALALGSGMIYAFFTFYSPFIHLSYGLSWALMTIVAFAASMFLADHASRQTTLQALYPLPAYRRLLIWSFALFFGPVLIWRMAALALVSLGIVSAL